MATIYPAPGSSGGGGLMATFYPATTATIASMASATRFSGTTTRSQHHPQAGDWVEVTDETV